MCVHRCQAHAGTSVTGTCGRVEGNFQQPASPFHLVLRHDLFAVSATVLNLWASWPATSRWVSHLDFHLLVGHWDYSVSLPWLSFSGYSGDEMQVFGCTESAFTQSFHPGSTWVWQQKYALIIKCWGKSTLFFEKVGAELTLFLPWILNRSHCGYVGSADFIYWRFLITLTFHSQTQDYLDYLSLHKISKCVYFNHYI